MYLKNIKAHGFKSFADRIDMEINPGITGVVGPNGSGKSNIVDAIRWVLGEQSIKSLRGDGNMADVIFSGSKSRNAMNVASVTLVFDNRDHYLPIEYDEVSLQRRVYKDGTNEYFLNGEKCRLKDLTEILLDTGIAKESFNIISQGKIEEIISSKPSDRRIIFEEAAGVLKYKKRKEEALRKLERTHDNMDRVGDIIKELEIQVEPLKQQKEKAELYLKNKEELEHIEIALIAHDINQTSEAYHQKKQRIEELNKELLHSNLESNKGEAKIEAYKLEITRLENQISSLQTRLLEMTKLAEQINSKKNILLERKKYEVEDKKIHEEMIVLKEQELQIQSRIQLLNSEIEQLNREIEQKKKKLSHQEELLSEIKQERRKKEELLAKTIRIEQKLQIEIERLQESTQNNGTLPPAVKSVLAHPTLQGIEDAIGNIIEVDEQNTKAISTALGASSNYIIVETEQNAKEAITYLKQNKLGRATFFPLSIIKPRYIEEEMKQSLKNNPGYIGVASTLVHYNPKFKNIIENQLGNVIVVDTLDNANIIARQIQYRYRIVTLDGEIIHVGGSLTGGESSKNRNILSEKQELENKIKQLQETDSYILDLEDKINQLDEQRKQKEDEIYLSNKAIIEIKEIIKNKEQLKSGEQLQFDRIAQEIEGANHLLNQTLSEEETTILNQYYEAQNQKREIELELNEAQNQKQIKTEELKNFEFEIRRENSLLNAKNKELQELEIEVNRIDVKLDHDLTTLNETYNMTYEKAKNEYVLEMEEEIARTKVMNLKRTLKELGMVNLGAIEEYARVSERYEFLLHQREDLTQAENTLLEIISEMDTVMEHDFLETFQIIKTNFTETFQELFHGGKAELKLTDPNSILETGIEIIASPPGKKLTSISLLSGGEKTFTAISLLFAILKSRPVPFCVLDEVEAALDEVNVDSFGDYLSRLKQKTQFILITHKKKTMEYADVLYGITMQESGVSKLVSVKLEEIK